MRKIDDIVNSCGPLLLRDLTGFEDDVVLLHCSSCGWKEGSSMRMDDFLAAAKTLGLDLDWVESPRWRFSSLLSNESWNAKFKRGTWVIKVRSHVFGIDRGEMKGYLKSIHLRSKVQGMWRQR